MTSGIIAPWTMTARNMGSRNIASGAKKILAVLGGLGAAATAAAQTSMYEDVTATHLPPDFAGPCMDAAAGDADGDGDLDLALAMEFQPNILLLNDGAGRFTVGQNRLPRTLHDTEDVAFADFDDDGDLDLVWVSEDDLTDELYINDGTGRFTQASMQLPTNNISNALAVMDLNDDGALDVLTGNIGIDRALINDGSGHFRDETAARWAQDGTSRTQDLEVADIDGDGDLDVVLGNEGQNQLFINEAGRLIDVTAERLPVRSDETREIRAVDVDGDGDLDLLTANVSFLFDDTPLDYLLINDGSGTFAAADSARFPEDARSDFTIQAADLDRDGDMDVLIPSTLLPDNRRDVESATRASGDVLVLLNDGSGRFSAAVPGQVLPTETVGNGFDIEVADFNRDGFTDLFMCNRGSIAAPASAAAASGGVQRLLLGSGKPLE